MSDEIADETRYYLTINVFAETPEVEITPSEFEDARDSKKLLVDTLGLEESLNLVFENYLEYGTELLGSALRSLVHKPGSWSDFTSQIHEVNRRVINLLAGCRSYLDQSRHFLSERFGSESGELSQFNQWASDEYDTHFGFRAMEALRNYAQHRGLAVHTLSFQLWIEGKGDDIIRRNSLAAFIHPKFIAEDGKFNARILEELGSIGGPVDIRPLLDEYVAGIARVHFRLRDLLSAQVDHADVCIQGLIDRYKEQGQEQVLGLVALEVDSSGQSREEVQLFKDLITRRKSLVKRTQHTPHIAGLYTTNEPNRS